MGDGGTSHVWYLGEEGVGIMSGVWVDGDGIPISQCIMGNGHIGAFSNRITDTRENATLPQLRLWR